MGIRENNETTNAHNEQSLADNMKRMFELVNLNAYTAEQALANMDLHNTSVSAAQMWLQQYKVVAVNWKGYLLMQMRRGQAMVPTKFFSSPVAKAMSKDLMSLYIQEVHPLRSLTRTCCRAPMTVLFSGR